MILDKKFYSLLTILGLTSIITIGCSNSNQIKNNIEVKESRNISCYETSIKKYDKVFIETMDSYFSDLKEDLEKDICSESIIEFFEDTYPIYTNIKEDNINPIVFDYDSSSISIKDLEKEIEFSLLQHEMRLHIANQISASPKLIYRLESEINTIKLLLSEVIDYRLGGYLELSEAQALVDFPDNVPYASTYHLQEMISSEEALYYVKGMEYLFNTSKSFMETNGVKGNSKGLIDLTEVSFTKIKRALAEKMSPQKVYELNIGRP